MNLQLQLHPQTIPLFSFRIKVPPKLIFVMRLYALMLQNNPLSVLLEVSHSTLVNLTINAAWQLTTITTTASRSRFIVPDNHELGKFDFSRKSLRPSIWWK